MTTDSVCFDRAADYYDKTRSLDPVLWSKVIELLLGEIKGRGLVLEAGVGTGRAAIPVAEAGIRLVGIDISEAMMAKLRSKAEPPLPLAAADATRMPFAEETFGAAYLIHVLHLVPAWRAALSEIARVVRRPGVVLIDIGSLRQRGMSSRVTHRFAREAGSTLAKLMPAWFTLEELDAAMAECGGALRVLPEMTITRPRSIRSNVDEMAAGIHAFTWALDEQTRRRAGERTLAWAERQFGSVDTVRPMRWRIAWRAYDLT